MSNPETQDYDSGKNLIAGFVSTDQVKLAADTYYVGMRLEYQADGTVTADGSNTGDGTVTAVVAGAVPAGDYNLECTVAVTNGGVFKLEDPNGNIIASELRMDAGAGAATIFVAAGITFTITDGATDFVVGDKFTLAIESAGEYALLANGTLAAIYNGDDADVLSSAAYRDVIVAGEIYEDGIKSDTGADVTLTEDDRAAYRNAGFYIKRK